MLTPRLTNCQDCHKIPDLLKQIDCKLAELGNDMYNNIVFMLGNHIPATTIMQLTAYKRILTFKYCNPHYAGSCSVNDIAAKVIRLTAGCVSRCNEPTVCEITTCCVDVVPNPTTTTTSTSSTSTTTTTSTSTSSTTTTTTTIFPDCRIEGCFEKITTTTTTSSTSSTTTTTTTTAAVTGCNQPFNFNAPEGFPGINTGNGIKTLSNGTVLTMTSSTSDCNPVYIPGDSPQLDDNNWGDDTCGLPGVHHNQFNNQGFYTLGSGSCSQTTLQFSESVGALAFYQSGIGYYPNPGVFETINVTGDVDLNISTIGVCEENPGDWQIINEPDGSVTFKGRLLTGGRGLVSLFAIYPRNIGDRIGELAFTHIGDSLAGCGLDFYLCPDDQNTTTTTSTSSSSTTTTSTSTSTSTTTTTTTATPNVKLNWDLITQTAVDGVSAEITRNGISSGTLGPITSATSPLQGLVLCNPGDNIVVTLTTEKAGTYAFTNRATLDTTIILNETSSETGSKTSTVSFVKSADTEDLDIIGNVFIGT